SVDLSRHWRYSSFIDYYYSSLSITGAPYWLPQVCKAKRSPSFFLCKSIQIYHEDKGTAELMNLVRKMEVDIHLQRILLKVDRASMYHSLEVRVPFLSNRMLDYSLSCSYNQCIKEEQGKMILKNSLAEKT